QDQPIDIHSAIINEPTVRIIEYDSTIDLAIFSVDFTWNSRCSQVDDLVSDQIVSHVIIQNSFILAPQASIMKWNTRRSDT
ncbi:hypothetical protein LSH36_13g17022, partial [Paralvinella palmiformis]